LIRVHNFFSCSYDKLTLEVCQSNPIVEGRFRGFHNPYTAAAADTSFGSEIEDESEFSFKDINFDFDEEDKVLER